MPCCYNGHYCLDNGLCWAKTSNTMYRGSCTDPDFKSDNCGQFCLGDGWGGMFISQSAHPKSILLMLTTV